MIPRFNILNDNEASHFTNSGINTPNKDSISTPLLFLNGDEIEEKKQNRTLNISNHLDKSNFQNWDFKNLNMIIGTDSQPFITFITQSGDFHTMGIKTNMSIRNHQSVIRLDGERFVFSGGVNHLFNHVTSKTFEYNIKTSKYTKMGSLINRRFFAQIVFTRGRLFMLGGRDYGNDRIAILNTCEEYNFGTKEWTPSANLNFSRCNFTSIVYQNNIYVFSGLNKTSKLLNSIEKFNFSKNRWEVLGLEICEDMLGNLGFHRNHDIMILGGTRSWGPGAVVKMNLEFGADLGETEVTNINNKNALSKPMILNKHILALGGFFSHVILIDKYNLKVIKDSSKLDPYKKLIDHIERLCIQSYRLTKCSFVLPLDNRGGRI